MTLRTAALVVITFALVVAACGGGDDGGKADESSDPVASLHTLRGSIAVGGQIYDTREPCRPDGGFSDMRRGAQVVIKNDMGTVVASSRLGTGVAEPPRLGASTTSFCVFPFEVTSVPTEKFYSVEIGNRSEIVYSFEDLQSAAWQIDLTLR